MWRLLKFIVTGDFHLHQWEIQSQNQCSGPKRASWTRYYLRCKHCGNMKISDPN